MTRRAFDTRGNLDDHLFRCHETPYSDVMEHHTVPATRYNGPRRSLRGRSHGICSHFWSQASPERLPFRLYFGRSPRGAMFVYPFGRRHPRFKFSVKDGQLLISGCWNTFEDLKGHPGFRRTRVYARTSMRTVPRRQFQ
jgi:hypothetical protein